MERPPTKMQSAFGDAIKKSGSKIQYTKGSGSNKGASERGGKSTGSK
jgi:hypothetical protein